MPMFGQVIKVFKALNSDARPWQLSLGVCFGAVIGLTPISSLHNILVLFLALIINLNIGLLILSFVLFSGIAYILDPLFHQIGYALLTSGELQAFWTGLFSNSIFLLANLNNSIVLGSLVCSGILALPLFFLFNLLTTRYRDTIKVYIDKIPLLKSLKVIKLYETFTGGGK